jgi:hypothetical protein
MGYVDYAVAQAVSRRIRTEAAVAQAVSRRIPTEAAVARARFKLCWMFGGQRGTEVGFLRVLRFPLPLIQSTNCSTFIIYHSGVVQ